MAPNLDDPKLFDRRPGVPLLDVHEGRGRTVDEAKLRLVASNSNRRASGGDPALMFIGHTDADRPETAQPPLVGYVKNFQVGRHNGRPCILADLFFSKSRATEAFEFPRRSVEIYFSESTPENNYIDAVSLLKRSPERNLGLVTYAAQGRVKERYAMADSNPSQESLDESDIEALTGFMQRKNIRDVAEGIRAYLRAKADGTVDDTGDEFGQDDIPQLDKFMKANGIKVFAEGLARYKKAKRDGTLVRY